MKTIINEFERGLLFENGCYIKTLTPGKYVFFSKAKKVIVCDTNKEFTIKGYSLTTFEDDAVIKSSLDSVDVPDESIALHYINGKFAGCLKSGRYAFWNVFDKHEFKIYSIKNPEVPAEIPEYILNSMPSNIIIRVEVPQYQKALLYINKKFFKLLDEGAYYFWNNGSKIESNLVDTRLLQMDIAGQEMLTLDKVSVRVNFVCHYKISDYIKVFTEIENYKEQMHVTTQLALRDYIGRYRLDEILENKEQITQDTFEKLKEKENELFIKVFDAGIKDIILPGEIRDIMNTVLIAEKKAQANVITRREEVASTRSLLNTAKLMDENQTLYRLKELEYIEKICDNVGSITVNGGSDLLSQLTTIMKGKAHDV